MGLGSTPFASPYPQTPTPGGSTNNNQLNRPPLTSLKPFGYNANFNPLIKKPHPLAQVSMIDSLSTIANDTHSLNRRINPSSNNITLNKLHNDADQSLEDDLLAFEQEQKNFHPSNPIHSNLSVDLTEDDSNSNSTENKSNQTTTNDNDQVSEFDQDTDSFRIGLSSLSPPGIGRSAHPNPQLSTVSLDPEDDDFHYPTGQDFSRDLSALSLSPTRRTSAPTPPRSNPPLNQDQNFTIEDDRSQAAQNHLSGFQGVARQLKHDFVQFSTLPTNDHSKKKKPISTRKSSRGGTLRGGLPSNDSSRAKRVFGSELTQGLKPPRLHQLHSVGLTSTPPTKCQTSNLNQFDQTQQQNRNNASIHLNNHPPDRMHKPAIRIVDATSDPNNHHTSFNTSLPSGARKIVGNSIRVPDVTGLTDALRSPDMADLRLRNISPETHPSGDNARPDPTLSEALSILRRRLTSLESENVACQTRIRDLQLQLNHSNQSSAPCPPGHQGLSANNQHDRFTKPSSQPAIERMVQKLKIHTRRLNDSIEAHAIALEELNAFKSRHKNVRQELRGVKSEVRQWSDEVDDMKDSLEGLTDEVREIRNMIENLINTAWQSVSGNNAQTQSSSQHVMNHQATTDSKAPLSKSQQESKRNSRSAIPQPHVQSQKTRNVESQPQAQPQKMRNSDSHPTAQSHQTHNDIEDWRSQTSTVPNSGRSFLGPDEIKRLKKEVTQVQVQKSTNKAPTNTQPKPSTSNPSVPVPQPPPVFKQPIASSSRTAPTRTTSAPNMKFTGSAGPSKAADELLRGEAILNSIPKGRHDDTSCSQCRLRRQRTEVNTHSSRNSSAPVTTIPNNKRNVKEDTEDDGDSNPPPQTVLVKLLRDLEDDFEAHRKIFVELSETYRKMNPASIQTTKRKALAQHLRESVDTLEKKAGHIKDLYNLLHVKDVTLKSGSQK